MKTAFQARIVERFLKGDAYKRFCSEYNDNRHNAGSRSRAVTQKDLMILIDYKKGALPNEISKKFGISRTKVNTSLRLAALSKI